MTEYHFNVELAQRHGVNGAIFLHAMAFWIAKNQANGRHFHKGRTWTYNSLEALTKLFPFWTRRQLVYTILMSNPAVFDGVALFDPDHGNLIQTGSAPSVESMQKLMLKLLLQKNPFGEAITIQPRTVVVPVGMGSCCPSCWRPGRSR